MFGEKESEYKDKSKEELKQRLHVLNYEIATTNDRKQLRAFSKEIHDISKELKRRRKMEDNLIGRRGR